MSTNPTPILVRLQELKLWQGNYDSLLQNRTNNNTNLSDYETIEGLSALDTTHSNRSTPEKRRVDLDRRQISPSKPFEQLLEEKLAQELEPVDVHVQPKRPFLKKGSGLSRYRLKSTVETENYSSKTRRKRKKSSGSKTGEISSDFTPLKVPELVIKPKGKWCSVREDKFGGSDENCNERTVDFDTLPQNYTEINNKSVSSRFNSEIIGKISEYSQRHRSPKAHKKKSVSNKAASTITNLSYDPYNHGEQTLYERALENELKIFEALEERAENSSFCSTNSSVLQLLSSSTPHKQRQQTVRSPIPEEQHSTSDVANEPKDTEKCLDLHQKLQEVHHKTEFLNIFMNKLKKMSDVKMSKRCRNNSTSTSPDKTMTNNLESDLSFSDDEKWSVQSQSPTNSGSFSGCEMTNGSIPDKASVAVNTSFCNELTQTDRLVCPNCEVLQKKLAQHGKEMMDVYAEKGKLGDLVKELEKKRDQLNRDANKMKQKHEEDLLVLKSELEGERKKLAKEKMVFDTYIKDSQNRSCKKDREEISNIKKELADVQELLKLKESKNGACQARLRNQIKQLEKDNIELKGDVEKLTKENAKLNANQKLSRRPSETKMLHEINKNLTKLTEETFKKQQKGDLKENVTVERLKSNKEVTVVYGAKQPPKLANTLKHSRSKLSEDYTTAKETSTLDFTNFSNVSLEKRYENVFGQLESPGGKNSSLNDSKKERIECLLEDGSKEVKYSNGNCKTISADGNFVVVKYYNGDIKQTNLRERTLKYYYAASSTWHTQYADGSELVEFANGQTERKYKDGRYEINYPDGVVQMIMPDGTEEATYEDGSILIVNAKKERILHFPNGQKEIHTKDQKRREYPNGTVKILYPDGTQETRYPEGRVRMKDANGVLIMDTDNPPYCAKTLM